MNRKPRQENDVTGTNESESVGQIGMEYSPRRATHNGEAITLGIDIKDRQSLLQHGNLCELMQPGGGGERYGPIKDGIKYLSCPAVTPGAVVSCPLLLPVSSF